MASLHLAPNATTGDWNGGRRRGSDQGVMGDFHLHPPYGRSHSEVVTTGPRKVVCLDFSRGHCMKGINCPWSHDTMSNTHGQTRFTAFPTHNSSPFPTYMQQGGKGQAFPSTYETHHNRGPIGFPHHQAPIPNPPLAPYRRRSPILSDRAAQPLLTFGDLPLHQASAPTGPVIDNGTQRMPHERAPSPPSMHYAPRSMPPPGPQMHPPHVVPPRFAGGNLHQGDYISKQRPPQAPPGPVPMARLRGGYIMPMTRQPEPPPLHPLNTNTPRSPSIGDGMPRWSNTLPSKQEWHPRGPTVVRHTLSPPEATPSQEGTPWQEQAAALSPATKGPSEGSPSGEPRVLVPSQDSIPPLLWQSIMKTAQPPADENGMHGRLAPSPPNHELLPDVVERSSPLQEETLHSDAKPAIPPADSKNLDKTIPSGEPQLPPSPGPLPPAPAPPKLIPYDERPRIRWKSGQICRLYQLDRCEQGPRCLHHHIRLTRTLRRTESTTLCRNFLLWGRCNLNDCWRVHINLNEHPELLRRDPVPEIQAHETAGAPSSSAPHPRPPCPQAESISPPSSHEDRGATTSTAGEARGAPSATAAQAQRTPEDEGVVHQFMLSSSVAPTARADAVDDDVPTPRPPVRMLPEGPSGERLEVRSEVGLVDDERRPIGPERKTATTSNPATPLSQPTKPLPASGSRSGTTRAKDVAAYSAKGEPPAVSHPIGKAAETSASGEVARKAASSSNAGASTSSQQSTKDARTASQTKKAKALAPRAASPTPSNVSQRSFTPSSVNRADSRSGSKGKRPQTLDVTQSPIPSSDSPTTKKSFEAVKETRSENLAADETPEKPSEKQGMASTEEPKSVIAKPAAVAASRSKGLGSKKIAKSTSVSIPAETGISPPEKPPAASSSAIKQKAVSQKVVGDKTSSETAAAQSESVKQHSTPSPRAGATIALKDAPPNESGKTRVICKRFQETGKCRMPWCRREHVPPSSVTVTQAETALTTPTDVGTASAPPARDGSQVDRNPGDDESVTRRKSTQRHKGKQNLVVPLRATDDPSSQGCFADRHLRELTTDVAVTTSPRAADRERIAPPSAVPMTPSLSTSTTSSEGSSYPASLASSQRSSPRANDASIPPMVPVPGIPLGVCRDWWWGRCHRADCIFAHSRTADTRQVTAEDDQARPGDHPVAKVDHRDKTSSARPAKYVTPDPRPRTPQKSAPLVPPGLGLETKIAPLTSPPRREPDDTITITVLDATRVTFGPGLEVRRLQTGFESTQVFLSDLPSSVTPAAITLALDAFGDVTAVNMMDGAKHSKGAAARVTFSKPEEAAQAVDSLDGAQLMGTTVSARPDTFRSSVGKGTLRDGDVLIAFPAPNRTGYVGYATMKEAEKAIKKANNYEMRGNLLRAVHYEGLPMVGSHNVRFVGLPGDATPADLDVFGPNEGVMMKHPLYVSLKRAIDGLLSMLLKFDSSVTLNVLPPPYKRDVRAWAHFSKPSIAERFCETAHGHRHGFIGNSSLIAKHFRTLAWTLPGNVYDVLSDEIRLLRAYLWDTEFSTSISIFDKRWGAGRTAPVKVKLVSSDIQKLTKPKAAFEALLRGERVTQDGETVWDGYFSSRPGIVFLEELERNHRGVLINKDTRRRTLALFGSPILRGRVRDAIVAKFNLLRKQRIHIIPLGGRLIGLFVKTDLHLLQDQLGRENVILDLDARALKVRGGEDAHKAGQLAIARARTRHPGERQSQSSECPVCLDDVTDPYTLKCGHTYCRTCVSDYLVAATDTKVFPLTCLGDDAKCSHHIPLDAAQQLLPPDAFEALTRSSFLAYIHSRPKEFFYCPTPDCEQVYRATPKGKVLQCPSCLVQICGHCHVEYHTGEECHDLEAEDQAHFEEWKKGRDVKNCPSCRATIEREAGCNHMTCTRCKTHICWVCLETFEKGEDVYPHMRTIHGGIGL